MVSSICHSISHADINGYRNIWIHTSDCSQVSRPVFLFFFQASVFHPIPEWKKKEEECDECDLTAHNIPFSILCSTFSVFLSQLKNCLMLMHSDLEIKHQSGSLLVDSVGLHVHFLHQKSPTALLGMSISINNR